MISVAKKIAETRARHRASEAYFRKWMPVHAWSLPPIVNEISFGSARRVSWEYYELYERGFVGRVLRPVEDLVILAEEGSISVARLFE